MKKKGIRPLWLYIFLVLFGQYKCTQVYLHGTQCVLPMEVTVHFRLTLQVLGQSRWLDRLIKFHVMAGSEGRFTICCNGKPVIFGPCILELF